jgi:hypothetical protein
MLLGIKRGLFTSTVSTVPEIASARYSLFPFWAPIFPKKESQIKVNFK